MLHFVKNGLKDNDGEVLEEGAGEEVHLTCEGQARDVSSHPTSEAAGATNVPGARRR